MKMTVEWKPGERSFEKGFLSLLYYAWRFCCGSAYFEYKVTVVPHRAIMTYQRVEKYIDKPIRYLK
jgi:hypothetical protein